MKKYAVLTNDMQVAIANKHKERKVAVNRFLPNIRKFLQNMRNLQVPVIHLQLIIKENDPRSSEPYGPFPPLLKGSEGVAILKEVFNSNDFIIEKNKDSGFFETNLDQKLKELEITDLIITGMQTQICVQTTAADAYFRGYRVIVPTDTVGSTREEDTKRSLEWLANYCAKVVPSNEVYEKIKLQQDL